VALPVVEQTLLHVVQLVVDIDETVEDKCFGLNRSTVFFPDYLLVVEIHEGVDYVDAFLGLRGGEADAYDCGGIGGVGDVEASRDAGGGPARIGDHAVLCAVKCADVGRFVDCHGAGRQLYVHRQLDVGEIFFLFQPVIICESLDVVFVVVLLVYGDGDIRAQMYQVDRVDTCHKRIVVIQRYVAQIAFAPVAVRQFERVHDADHTVARFEYLYFRLVDIVFGDHIHLR